MAEQYDVIIIIRTGAGRGQLRCFVGGATKYGAALYRLRPQDFGEVKHVDGISPAWLSCGEPWYTRAEEPYQVHGNGDEDPSEGHRSAPYPTFFPNIGAVNPALTAIAKAVRVGEHVTERLAS